MKQEFVLDFNQLEDWRDVENDNLPIHGMISFYRATGIADFVMDNKDRFLAGIAAIDNISCNFYTQKRIKNFIAERWQVFSMSLLDHNVVKWNTHTYAKGEKHYARRLSKRVESSLLFDFINYCPRIDDELPDNVIIVSVEEPDDGEKTQETQEQTE